MFKHNSQDDEVLAVLKKRRNIYTIITVVLLVIGGTCGVIPVIGWYLSTAMLVLEGIAAGLAMFCINNYRYIKSGGTKQGGGLWWLLLFIFGFIVMPIITVFICRHIRPLAEKVLGVTIE